MAHPFQFFYVRYNVAIRFPHVWVHKVNPAHYALLQIGYFRQAQAGILFQF